MDQQYLTIQRINSVLAAAAAEVDLPQVPASPAKTNYPNKSVAAKTTWEHRNPDERRRILGPANLNATVAGLIRRRNRAVNELVASSEALDRILTGNDAKAVTVVNKQISRFGLVPLPNDLPFINGEKQSDS